MAKKCRGWSGKNCPDELLGIESEAPDDSAKVNEANAKFTFLVCGKVVLVLCYFYCKSGLPA
jgi:hypothetical protein